MQKISLLSFLILFWVFPSLAQSVVNADKNYASDKKSMVISITATAILDGKPDFNEVNYDNYHRAVSVGDEPKERNLHPPVVEVTIAVQEATLSAESTVKKEAILVTPQNPAAEKRLTPQIVEIIAPAVKQ